MLLGEMEMTVWNIFLPPPYRYSGPTEVNPRLPNFNVSFPSMDVSQISGTRRKSGSSTIHFMHPSADPVRSPPRQYLTELTREVAHCNLDMSANTCKFSAIATQGRGGMQTCDGCMSFRRACSSPVFRSRVRRAGSGGILQKIRRCDEHRVAGRLLRTSSRQAPSRRRNSVMSTGSGCMDSIGDVYSGWSVRFLVVSIQMPSVPNTKSTEEATIPPPTHPHTHTHAHARTHTHTRRYRSRARCRPSL